MTQTTSLLIIGAGPYGLSLAAHAKAHGIDYVLVGRPMGFWRNNMPQEMYLRSGRDWHFDTADDATIDRYIAEQGLEPADVEPLSLAFYLGYCDWFQQQKGIEVLPHWVRQLDYTPDTAARYRAELDTGDVLLANNVVLALGFHYFSHRPQPYPSLFPADRLDHTCDFVDFAPLVGKRVLIVGGRQSAFEWAALLREQGVEHVYLSYRHPTPAFAIADWSWVNPVVDNMVQDPAWFRRMTDAQKADVNHRLWVEGRLKLEPWLADRVLRDGITLLPESHITGCDELPSGALAVQIDGTTVEVDHVIMATGYRVDVSRVPLLTAGNILPQLATDSGFPSLDEHFQSNLPGLFFTSMCGTQAFGPFFAFTAGVRTSARLIGQALTAKSPA